MFTYKLRWSEKMAGSATADNKIPFKRNTVTLPPNMNEDLEQQLTCLKRDILKVTEVEAKKVEKNEKYRTFTKNLMKSKKFFSENNLVAVQSDKTNRLVLTEKKRFMNRLETILEDSNTYKKVESKQNKIEKQANMIIKNVCTHLPKRQTQKLLSSGSRPAKFQAFIKDHKERTEGNFPLRPIASVRNTAIEKVDWLVSEILSQLVNYVSANVRNSSEVIHKITALDYSQLSTEKTFISLDVVNLYPSIEIGFGIEAVLDLAKDHWHEIDNWQMTLDNLKTALTFICYNYEIQFEEKTFLQIKGCPMGAHFAPPFAIITMGKIEKLALEKLEEKYDYVPDLYLRYIDDCIIGPIHKNGHLPHVVLEAFNSVNENIKFTLDLPDHALNFLDISIRIVQKNIEYWWYTKPCHSSNSLKRDSFVPNHVKHNFVQNYIKNVDDKCSNEILKTEAQSKLQNRFMANGFYDTKKRQTRRKKMENNEYNILQLDFISDACNRKLRDIIKRYDFKIKVVSKPFKYLKDCLRKNENQKHENCSICKILPRGFKCDDRFLVYKFTCKFCNGDYIGETCRPFKERYSEHSRSIRFKNKTSALSDHAISEHKDTSITIDDFDLNIIKRCVNPLETRLSEVAAIERSRPSLNRKHERI